MAEKTDAQLKRIYEYVLKKKELLENIYDISSRRSFQGSESEIDEFVEYLDVRQPYYEQLAELDSEYGNELSDFELDFDNEKKLYRDVSQALSNVTDIAARIKEIDTKNNANMQNVCDSLLSEIKKISTSRKARASYNFFQVQGGNSR